MRLLQHTSCLLLYSDFLRSDVRLPHIHCAYCILVSCNQSFTYNSDDPCPVHLVLCDTVPALLPLCEAVGLMLRKLNELAATDF